MLKPKVSVVMAVYNGEQYLQEAIESILSQTFSDFEFIIVDDASTDCTPEIVQNYAKYDKRIRLMRNKRNLGLTKSLNRGLNVSQGIYIARQDADDLSLPKRLELQVHFLDDHIEIGALGAGVEIVDEKGSSLKEMGVPVAVSYTHLTLPTKA